MSGYFKSATFFLLANILGGVFHYLYNIIAGRNLDPSEFAELNAWLAHFAAFSLISALLQISANFFPQKLQKFRLQILLLAGVVFLNLGVLVFPISQSPFTIYGLALVLGSVLAWISGQIQIRQLFISLGFMNLLVGAFKMTLVFLLGAVSELTTYYYAVLFSYLPAIALGSYVGWLKKSSDNLEIVRELSGQRFTSALIISFVMVMLPQVDILILVRTVSSLEFEEFSRASIFYKGIFFFVLIFAQWLLPQQIQSESNIIQKPITSYPMIFLISIIAALIAIISPFVSQWVLAWKQPPSMELVFLSCVNMGLLTWIYLLIQESCSRKQMRLAGITFLSLISFAILQYLIGVSSRDYLYIAIGLNLILVLYNIFGLRKLNL